MHIPIVLAHGAVGPLDELLPPILLGAILGLIVITWWNGRKIVPQSPDAQPTLQSPDLAPSDPTDAPSDDAPAVIMKTNNDLTDAEPESVRVPTDETHFPVP